MRVFFAMLATLFCALGTVVAADPAGAADPATTAAEASKPAVLICKWAQHSFIDYTWLEGMQKQGFTVDVTSDWSDVTWERISKYNAIMVMGFPYMEDGEVRGLTGRAADGLGPEATLSLLDRYMQAGGGVLFCVHRAGQTAASYRTVDAALQHYDARLPLETITVPAVSEAWHPRIRMPYCYTTQVNPETPVSADVHGIWWPNPPRGITVNYTRFSGPLALGDSWQTVVRAPRGSRTAPYTNPNEANWPEAQRLTDALQRPDGVEEPPLFGIREYQGGRLALFHAMDVFHVGSGTYWMHNGAMLDKGLGGKPSDFGRLLSNTFRWLAAPSLESGALGGAVVDPEVAIPPKLRAGVQDAFYDDANAPRRAVLDPAAPLMPVKHFRGLIGARSASAGGTGTPAEYAAAAKAAGLDFVVFLDPFAESTEAAFKQLVTDCAAASDEQLLVIPGYRMEANIGNRMFFYGTRPSWPDKVFLSERDPTHFRLNGESPDGTFWQKGMGLDFLIKDFMGRENDRVGHNNLGYYDFAHAAEVGGMQPEHCKAFGALGVMYYADGKLQEDVSAAYLRVNAGCMSALPVVINLVNSPAELAASVARGDAMTVAIADSLAEVVGALNKNHQFEAPPVSVSGGPIIQRWPAMVRPFIYGDELFANERGLLDAELDVTSDVGLAEIAIYDGDQLFRRFLPDGAKRYSLRLYLSALVERNMSLIATDTAGHKALSFPLCTRKAGSAQAVHYCGDHVNHCVTVNMKMARGPNAWRSHSMAVASDVGHTWDGGPLPLQPLAIFDTFAPDLATATGFKQAGSPYQIPLLEASSERVIRTRSELSGTLPFSANAWRGWGPIEPPAVFSGHSTYTEFGRYVTGVDATAWGGPGNGGGTIAGLYEQELSFRVTDTVKSFRLTRGKRELVPQVRALLLAGIGDTLLAAHDFTPDADADAAIALHVPAGGWFAGVTTAGEANDFLCFTDQALDVSSRGGIFDINVSLPDGGLPVEAGQVHRLRMVTYMWPMDINLENSDAVLDLVRHLRHPVGMQVLQGTQLEDGMPGLVEFAADQGTVEIDLPRPRNNTIKEITPALRVHGLNPRWSAGFYQLAGYAGSRITGNGKGQYAPLGVDPSGRSYTPLYSAKADTHAVIGHPVVADAAGAALFIQVTALNGPLTAKNPGRWHISVNNPTDAPITTILRRRIDLPGMRFKEQTLTLAPGEYRLLEHSLKAK